MKRATYCTQPDVIDFVIWLGKIIQGSVPIDFCYGPIRGNVWPLLYSVLANYKWPLKTNNGPQPDLIWPFPAGAQFCLRAKSNLATNNAVLCNLQNGLRAAMLPSSGHDPALWVAAILIWGGVYTKTKSGGNKDWLSLNRVNVRSIINGTMGALSAGDDDLKKLKFLNLRFNSGMTKVYSLLLQDFIIYDSRVAAALAWLVWKWCKSRDPAVSSPPEALAFACMKANEPRNTKNPKIRNPCKSAFSNLNQNAYKHAKWNLRANWILHAAFSLPNSGETSVASGNFKLLREVEAALFTMGYDLKHAIAAGLTSPFTACPLTPPATP